MSTKTLQYRIGMDIGELRRQGAQAGQSVAAFNRELRELESKQRAHRAALDDLGKGMATFGLAVAAGLGVAAKAAIDWESAWTGVRKTVDGTDAEMAALESELRGLARTLPITHQEIAGVAEAAGQLGIKRQDVAGFTKTMVALGQTTNLTAEESATSLAKFSNIMGTSAADVNRLGSALVALGNDGASTEKDIIEMALRIAGAGKQIKLSEAEVLAFASALSSVGIEADAGGSAISRVMIDIASAVNEGGEKLDTFAKVAGMATDQFAQKFRTDAAGAIIAFIQGLGRMQQSGQDVFGVLDGLELSEIRVRDALLRAGAASDMFTKSISTGSKAWSENSALTDEANKRYGTAASQIQVAWNQIKDALIDVGQAVAPVVAGIASGVSDLVRGFQSLPGPVKDIVTWVGSAAAAIAVLGGAALIAVPKFLAFRESMTTLAASGGLVGSALGRFGLLLSGPWGAAIGLGIAALSAFAIGQADAGSATAQFSYEIDRQTKKLSTHGVEALHKFFSETKVGGESTAYFRDVLRKTGLTVEDAIGWLTGAADATEKVNAAMRKPAEEGGPLLRQFLEDQKRQYEEARKQQEDAAKAAEEHARRTGATGDAAEGATGKLGDFNAEMEKSKSAAEKAAEGLDDLIEKLNGINDTTLSYREAQRRYIEQVNETAETLKKNGKTLDENTDKGRENARALDAQATEANKLAEAAAREAEANGGAVAGTNALIASLEASRPKLIETAKNFGMNQEQAEAYANQVLAIPQPDATKFTTNEAEVRGELERVQQAIKGVPPEKKINVGVLSLEAQAKLEQLGYKVERLPDGTVNVFGNTVPAQSALDYFISRNQNRVIGVRVETRYATTGGGGRYLESAYGNIVSFGRGGFYENHAPQIAKARPGMFRMWAEPDTDRESYIPWAMDRRPRATAILRTTADAFGYALTPKQLGASATSSVAIERNLKAMFQVGIMGSRHEMMDWLVRSIDELKRRGRI